MLLTQCYNRLRGETKTIYMFEAKPYKSLTDVAGEVENRLGAIVDKLPGNFGAGERLKVYDWLVANKNDIKPLLDVTIDFSDDSLYSDDRNILDL